MSASIELIPLASLTLASITDTALSVTVASGGELLASSETVTSRGATTSLAASGVGAGLAHARRVAEVTTMTRERMINRVYRVGRSFNEGERGSSLGFLR